MFFTQQVTLSLTEAMNGHRVHSLFQAYMTCIREAELPLHPEGFTLRLCGPDPLIY